MKKYTALVLIVYANLVFNISLMTLIAYLVVNYSVWWLLLFLFYRMGHTSIEEKNEKA